MIAVVTAGQKEKPERIVVDVERNDEGRMTFSPPPVFTTDPFEDNYQISQTTHPSATEGKVKHNETKIEHDTPNKPPRKRVSKEGESKKGGSGAEVRRSSEGQAAVTPLEGTGLKW